MAQQIDRAASETGVIYCLVGGLAVAHYANPPVTVDADFLIGGGSSQLEDLRMAMGPAWRATPLAFASRLQGMPRRGYTLRARDDRLQIDLLASGMDEFLDSAVVDAQGNLLVVGAVAIPVMRAEELVVMKSLMGREKDIEDIVAIYEAVGSSLNTVKIDALLEKLI